MPSINVRLSVEQHEVLRRAAFEGRRSLQKEIVGRLFGGLAAGGPDVPEPGLRPSTEVNAGSNPAVGAPAANPRKRTTANGMCEHRVPTGSFCKRCGREV
jgi:hypothetical protein